MLRGLAAQTVVHYLRCARVFLAWLPGSLGQSLPALSAAQVVGYVRDWTARRQGASIDTVRLPALRSLLRYLHVAGHVPRSLAGAVPAGRGRPRNAMPRAASAEGVRAVLASCDRNSAVGRRDYAILLLMARLALRGGEVGRLELADVNWRCGEVIVRGKPRRVDVLPLPADVGAAMADYLLHARPATTARTLFVTVKAPFVGLATSIGHPGGGSWLRRCGRGPVRAALYPPYGGVCAARGRRADGGDRPVAAPRPAAHYCSLRTVGSGSARRVGAALPAGSRTMSMRSHVEEYLTMRRSLGFKLDVDGRMLLDFADRLDRAGRRTITVEDAVAWATEPAYATAGHRQHRLGVVRGFARYLSAFDPELRDPGGRPVAGP